MPNGDEGDKRRRVNRLRLGLLFSFTALLLLLTVEVLVYLHHAPRVYFQAWSSETMMQTVSIQDLRDAPFESLWHIHIQPPALDGIRALFAWIWSAKEGLAMLQAVDWSIYGLWAVVYGLMGFLVYWWVSSFARIHVAVGIALVFYANPASIFYATFLETTLPTAGLILGYMYLLWRIGTDRAVHPLVMAGMFLGLYFTRSLFQWPWVFLHAIVLFMLNYPRKKLIVSMSIIVLIVGLYSRKQYCQFGTVSTSTFTGLNLCKSIGWGKVWVHYNEPDWNNATVGHDQAAVLRRRKKINGAINFNNAMYVGINAAMIDSFQMFLSNMTIMEIGNAYRINAENYVLPPSSLTRHAIVKKLPYASVYNYLFSGWKYGVIVVIACVYIIFRRKGYPRLQIVALTLPVVAIVLLSILFERGENMRFRYFVEPVFLVGLSYAGTRLISDIRNARNRRHENSHALHDARE